ncbi:MAG: hypothetical protein M1834_000928 [Cirrosporium novae-zelandiae]|nr:MAG: hypothetical protein M1834_000928 [Cirrosporium novae-zelandiae]
MPSNSPWSKNEKAILIYFASRGVHHQACADLINHKCNSVRSVSGARDQIKKIRKEHPELRYEDTNEWNICAVDGWLEAQNIPNLPGLVMLWKEEEELVSKVKI